MGTWTELLGRAQVDHYASLSGLAEEIRELLLDLPHHPNVGRVREIMLTTDDGDTVALTVEGPPLSSGASGPILPGAGMERDAVQPWRVTPVLGDAGVKNLLPASEVGLGTSWLEGIKYEPPKVTNAPDAMDRLIILPGDA